MTEPEPERSARPSAAVFAAHLDRGTTALLVVDVQNDYVDPKGVLGKTGADMTANVAMIPRLEGLIERARENDVFVVFTRNWHRPATDSEAWRERVERSGPLDSRPGRADTWGAEFYRVRPRDGEEVISKFRYDAFLGTSLEYILRARGISTVLVTGVTTNVCVESTARAAHMRDFHVLLVGDCCASDDQTLHEATLTNIERHFGDVVTAADVNEAWGREATDRAAGAPAAPAA